MERRRALLLADQFVLFMFVEFQIKCTARQIFSIKMKRIFFSSPSDAWACDREKRCKTFVSSTHSKVLTTIDSEKNGDFARGAVPLKGSRASNAQKIM